MKDSPSACGNRSGDDKTLLGDRVTMNRPKRAFTARSVLHDKSVIEPLGLLGRFVGLASLYIVFPIAKISVRHNSSRCASYGRGDVGPSFCPLAPRRGNGSRADQIGEEFRGRVVGSRCLLHSNSTLCRWCLSLAPRGHYAARILSSRPR